MTRHGGGEARRRRRGDADVAPLPWPAATTNHATGAPLGHRAGTSCCAPLFMDPLRCRGLSPQRTAPHWGRGSRSRKWRWARALGTGCAPRTQQHRSDGAERAVIDKNAAVHAAHGGLMQQRPAHGPKPGTVGASEAMMTNRQPARAERPQHTHSTRTHSSSTPHPQCREHATARWCAHHAASSCRVGPHTPQ